MENRWWSPWNLNQICEVLEDGEWVLAKGSLYNNKIDNDEVPSKI